MCKAASQGAEVGRKNEKSEKRARTGREQCDEEHLRSGRVCAEQKNQVKQEARETKVQME